jgi:hypothetical protein
MAEQDSGRNNKEREEVVRNANLNIVGRKKRLETLNL